MTQSARNVVLGQTRLSRNIHVVEVKYTTSAKSFAVGENFMILQKLVKKCFVAGRRRIAKRLVFVVVGVYIRGTCVSVRRRNFNGDGNSKATAGHARQCVHGTTNVFMKYNVYMANVPRKS